MLQDKEFSQLMSHAEGRLLLIFNREAAERKLDLRMTRIAPLKSVQSWTEDTPAAIAGDGRTLTITIPARRVAAIYLK